MPTDIHFGFTVTELPEPSAAAMLGAGVALLMVLDRRRRAKGARRIA